MIRPWSSGQSSGQPKNGSGQSAKDLGPGETAKYNNGVQVSVSKAAPYTVDPSTVVSGHTQGNKAYKLTVTVRNTGPPRPGNAPPQDHV